MQQVLGLKGQLPSVREDWDLGSDKAEPNAKTKYHIK